MGRNRYRLVFLSFFASPSLAGCGDIDPVPPPVWTPLDQLGGVARPELEQPPDTAARPSSLRLVSYNVRRGVDVDENAAYFLADLDLASADVIALQEATRGSGDDESDAGRFARRLGMGYLFVPTFEVDGDLQGLALLSRFPLLDVHVMRLGEETNADVLDPSVPAAIRATIETTTGPVQIVNVHLDVALNVPERILQLRPAVFRAPSKVAVLGDFNTNDYVWAAETVPLLPLDAVASTSQADALDGYMRTIGYDTPTAELGSTWGGFPENQRLDSIFTRGLATGRRAVERDLDTSDHWPIWLDVNVESPR